MGLAGDQYAQMTREMWNDYASNFVPIENKLIQYATDPGIVQQNVNRAIESVDTAFGAQQGMTQRRLQGLGTQMTPEQKAASDRETALQKSLGEVQAGNVARQQTIRTQMGIMGAPAPQGV